MSKSDEPQIVREVFEAWQEITGHKNARFTGNRARRVRTRLREGYTKDELILACKGAKIGAYVDKNGHKWDDLELICRSGSNVERFMALASSGADNAEKFLR